MTKQVKRPELNRAYAIREACIECMNYAVHEVNRCLDRACPLWEWRRGPGGPERSDLPLRRHQVGRSTAGRGEAVPGGTNSAEAKISGNRAERGV